MNTPETATAVGLAEAAALPEETAAPKALPSILYVDDDWNILEAFQRQFRKKYAIQTAVGPLVGLQTLEKMGPFHLVVSDLQMPVMNGIQFLAAVRAQAPDTVRIMLTGQGDLAAAVGAVNQGSIYRFLVKPCAPSVLEKVIEAGLEQYRLIRAEKDQMQETVLGCVHMMVDLLSTVNPHACGKANRIKHYMSELRHELRAGGINVGPKPWEFEAAGMLSQVAWISVPPELAEKAARGELSAQESQRVTTLAHAAARMIEKIPRLEAVAKIITGQNSPFNPSDENPASIAWGSQVLRCAADFDDLLQRGISHEDAVSKMRARPGLYSPQILTALASIQRQDVGSSVLDIRFYDLAPRMILEEDIVGSNGLCVLGKGQEITEATVERLSAFASLIPSDRRCKVRLHT
jgi:response regulator RpfG family c-di-GMP phosphodiesterase